MIFYVSQEIWLVSSKKNLNRPIKILHSLTPARIQKCYFQNIISKCFSFFNNKPPASCVAHTATDFLTFYSCSYYSSIFIASSWQYFKGFSYKFYNNTSRPINIQWRIYDRNYQQFFL